MIEGDRLLKTIRDLQRELPAYWDQASKFTEKNGILSACLALLFLVLLTLFFIGLPRNEQKKKLNSIRQKKRPPPSEAQKKETDKWITEILSKLPENMKLTRHMTNKNVDARLKHFKNICLAELQNPFHSHRQWKEIVEKSSEFLYGNYNGADDSLLVTFLETEIIAQLSGFLSKNGTSAGVVTGSSMESRMMAILNARNSLPESKHDEFTLLLVKGCPPDYYTLAEQLKIRLEELENIEDLAEFKSKPEFLAVVSCSSVLDGSFPNISFLKDTDVKVHLDVSSDGFFYNAALDKGLTIHSFRTRLGFDIGKTVSISIDLTEGGLVPVGIGFLLFKDHLEMYPSIYTTKEAQYEKHRCLNRITDNLNPAILIATWLSFAKLGDTLKDHAKTLKNNTEQFRKALEKNDCVKVIGDPQLGRILLKSNHVSMTDMEKLSDALLEHKIAVKLIPKWEMMEISSYVMGRNGVEELINLIKEYAPKCPVKKLSIYQQNYDNEGVIRHMFTSIGNIDVIIKSQNERNKA